MAQSITLLDMLQLVELMIGVFLLLILLIVDALRDLNQKTLS